MRRPISFDRHDFERLILIGPAIFQRQPTHPKRDHGVSRINARITPIRAIIVGPGFRRRRRRQGTDPRGRPLFAQGRRRQRPR
jgi:hypothetical protein